MTRLVQHTAGTCTNALKHIFTKHKHKRWNVTCLVRALFGVRRAIKNCAGSDVLSMKECCNHWCALQCLKIAALSTLQSFSSEPATTFLLLCPILLSETAVGLVLVRCDNNFNVVAKWAFVGYYQFKDVDQSSQYSFCFNLQVKGLGIREGCG